MVRPTFLVRLFAALSVAMVVALAFGVFAMTGTSAQASSGKGTPRFVQFHHNYADTDLAKSGLVTWSSTFTAEKQVWKYTMVGTNPKAGSKTTTVTNTIVPLIIKFSNGKSFDGTHVVAQTT